MGLTMKSRYVMVSLSLRGVDHSTIKPFTEEFPRADIHEILTADLLHQIIKGSFKDHLVEWIGDYLTSTEGVTRAKEIMDDID